MNNVDIILHVAAIKNIEISEIQKECVPRVSSENQVHLKGYS